MWHLLLQRSLTKLEVIFQPDMCLGIDKFNQPVALHSSDWYNICAALSQWSPIDICWHVPISNVLASNDVASYIQFLL